MSARWRVGSQGGSLTSTGRKKGRGSGVAVGGMGVGVREAVGVADGVGVRVAVGGGGVMRPLAVQMSLGMLFHRSTGVSVGRGGMQAARRRTRWSVLPSSVTRMTANS